jgi:hypothetical protein
MLAAMSARLARLAPLAHLAMIARWKPVHIGHAAVLEGLVASAESVIIGIGSSNRYNAKNPFTAAETADMLREPSKTPSPRSSPARPTATPRPRTSRPASAPSC